MQVALVYGNTRGSCGVICGGKEKLLCIENESSRNNLSISLFEPFPWTSSFIDTSYMFISWDKLNERIKMYTKEIMGIENKWTVIVRFLMQNHQCNELDLFRYYSRFTTTMLSMTYLQPWAHFGPFTIGVISCWIYLKHRDILISKVNVFRISSK